MADERRISSSLTIEQIKERVVHDLPEGTPLQAIDEYFSTNGIEHGYYKKSNEVLAMVKHIKGGQLLVDKGAQIIIELDDSGGLKDIEVRPVFTGP